MAISSPPRDRGSTCRIGAVLLGAALLGLPVVAEGQSTPGTEPQSTVRTDVYREWLEVVSPLLSSAEREVFLALEEDFQRDAFIRRFWQVRDPFPRTGHNEFRSRWEERLRLARKRYADPDEVRARMLVLVGQPDEQAELACTGLVHPLEIWYFEARDEIGSEFYLVFWSLSRSGRFELWDSNQGLELVHDDFMKARRKVKTNERAKEDMFSNRRAPWRNITHDQTADPENGPNLISQQADLFDEIILECPRGELIVSALSLAIDPELIRERFQPIPEPAAGWADRFLDLLDRAGADSRRVPTHEILVRLGLEARTDEGQTFPRLAPVFFDPTSSGDADPRSGDARSAGGR